MATTANAEGGAHCGDGVRKAISLDDSRGKSDHKAYRWLELANGMRVVLVSEPGCDDDVPADDSEAAVALGVAAGSFGDLEASSGLKPLQGRAHLTEHLLFMGSEKFTDENDYDRWVSGPTRLRLKG